MAHPTPAIVYPTLRQGADHGYRATCVHLPRVRHDPNPHLGRIDPVSVSHFARSTVDSLTTVRKLKGAGVEVYFEKENIWTSDVKGELLITIMSSLAQEEACSISENVTWGHRKRFADGKVSVPSATFSATTKARTATSSSIRNKRSQSA